MCVYPGGTQAYLFEALDLWRKEGRRLKEGEEGGEGENGKRKDASITEANRQVPRDRASLLSLPVTMTLFPRFVGPVLGSTGFLTPSRLPTIQTYDFTILQSQQSTLSLSTLDRPRAIHFRTTSFQTVDIRSM